MFRLKELRLENGYTQSFVANYLNIRQNTYSQYETGIRAIPIEQLMMLSKLYDTSVDYIIKNTDNPCPIK